MEIEQLSGFMWQRAIYFISSSWRLKVTKYNPDSYTWQQKNSQGLDSQVPPRISYCYLCIGKYLGSQIADFLYFCIGLITSSFWGLGVLWTTFHVRILGLVQLFLGNFIDYKKQQTRKFVMPVFLIGIKAYKAAISDVTNIFSNFIFSGYQSLFSKCIAMSYVAFDTCNKLMGDISSMNLPVDKTRQ